MQEYIINKNILVMLNYMVSIATYDATLKNGDKLLKY